MAIFRPVCCFFNVTFQNNLDSATGNVSIPNFLHHAQLIFDMQSHKVHFLLKLEFGKSSGFALSKLFRKGYMFLIILQQINCIHFLSLKWVSVKGDTLPLILLPFFSSLFFHLFLRRPFSLIHFKEHQGVNCPFFKRKFS